MMPPDTLNTYTLDDFDYPLPDALVAKYPLPERDQSRMMVVNRAMQTEADAMFEQLPHYLKPGDALVLNNARVIPARLLGHKRGHTGKVELFLLSPMDAAQKQWQVLMKPAKRLRAGDIVDLSDELHAQIVDKSDAGRGVITLHWPEALSLDALLQRVGHMPIPPYLQREADASDTERYQTVFAKVDGAQAAPTAGLHFTPRILHTLQNQGVHIVETTLHVSIGTFRPVLSEDIQQHQMDPEYYELSAAAAQTLQQVRHTQNKIVAVGTTSLKTLETIAQQNNGQVVAQHGWSDVFITPGFTFRAVDALLTNFHLPKSTLMMLVSAFAAHPQMMRAYQRAIEQQYRFYSYGDCMLII